MRCFCTKQAELAQALFIRLVGAPIAWQVNLVMQGGAVMLVQAASTRAKQVKAIATSAPKANKARMEHLHAEHAQVVSCFGNAQTLYRSNTSDFLLCRTICDTWWPFLQVLSISKVPNEHWAN